MKKIISVVLSLTMVLSVFGSILVYAENNNGFRLHYHRKLYKI